MDDSSSGGFIMVPELKDQETILILVVVSVCVCLSVCLCVCPENSLSHLHNLAPVRANLMKSSPTPMFVDPGIQMSSSISSSDERVHVILIYEIWKIVCHAFRTRLL